MSINVKAILDIWDWIQNRQGIDNEPFWYQKTWVLEDSTHNDTFKKLSENLGLQEHNYCGTAYCVAGKLTEPYQFRNHPLYLNGNLETSRKVTNHDGEVYIIQNPADYANTGAHILGITEKEADRLFVGHNKKEDIKNIFNNLLEKYGEAVRL